MNLLTLRRNNFLPPTHSLSPANPNSEQDTLSNVLELPRIIPRPNGSNCRLPVSHHRLKARPILALPPPSTLLERAGAWRSGTFLLYQDFLWALGSTSLKTICQLASYGSSSGDPPSTFQRLIVPSRLALITYRLGGENHALRSVTSCQCPSTSLLCSTLSSRSDVSHDLTMSPEAVNRKVPSNEGTYNGSSALTPTGCWIGLICRFFSLPFPSDERGWIFTVSSAEAAGKIRGRRRYVLSPEIVYPSKCNHREGLTG